MACPNVKFGKAVWSSSVADHILGGSGSDNVVWGSDCGGLNCDNVVWGSSGPDNVVWGSSILDNVVWGSSVLDNVVWGSSLDSNDVWGGLDNIVWGSSVAPVGTPSVKTQRSRQRFANQSSKGTDVMMNTGTFSLEAPSTSTKAVWGS